MLLVLGSFLENLNRSLWYTMMRQHVVTGTFFLRAQRSAPFVLVVVAAAKIEERHGLNPTN